MYHFANRDMKTVDIDDFIAWTVGEKDLPGGRFLLTFYDGFYETHEHAVPVLRELECPATVFLVSALLEHTQIDKMRKQGFSFHCHSRTHADPPKISDEIRWYEFAGARAELEGVLGSAVPYLGYPYGRYNERVVEIARQAGYRAGFSSRPGFNRQGIGPYKIRRLNVFGTNTPAQLMRKIKLGTNDGSLSYSIRYYLEHLKNRALGTPQ
jgi:peptidoglycan/xylan/chitin deacetylase (PgdA/CDA1 family)